MRPKRKNISIDSMKEDTTGYSLIKLYGFKKLGLLPLGYLYVIKPFIAGLVPQKIIKSFQRKINE